MGEVIVLDGLRNLTANLGTARDKAAHSFYHFEKLTVDQLRNAYRTAWLPRKIVDIPALDSFRRWRNWTANSAQISLIEAEEKRLGLRHKMVAAKTAARLFGGSALLIGTGEDDLSQPLDPESVSKGALKYVSLLDHRDLSAGDIEYSPASDLFGRPKFYNLSGGDGLLLQVHPSRLCIFIGAPLPDQGSTVTEPFGDSVLQNTIDAVKHADGTSANIASLVFEAKIDTVGIPDLSSKVSTPAQEAAVLQRLSLMATAKGNNGTLIHDTEEEIGQKTMSFSTLPDVMDRFFQNVAGAADIPITRLFGMSPAGMNSTGESDLRNYYDRIQASQELEVTPAAYVLDECLIRSALGTRPAEIFYSWSSLWQISDKERAEIGKITSETAKNLVEADVLSNEVINKPTANALIEVGAFPGLETEVEQYFDGIPSASEDDDEAAT